MPERLEEVVLVWRIATRDGGGGGGSYDPFTPSWQRIVLSG